MRRLIQTETGVRAFWELTSAGRRLQFHNGIRELIGQFPTGSYLLRTVSPEAAMTSEYLPQKGSPNRIPGLASVAKQRACFAINLSTVADLSPNRSTRRTMQTEAHEGYRRVNLSFVCGSPSPGKTRMKRGPLGPVED